MDRIPVVVATLLPALAVLLYGVIKTRGEWDGTLLKSFLIGSGAAAVCIPVQIALFHLLTPAASVTGAASTAALITAVPEEFAKFIALVGIAERYVDARRKQDILLLAIGVSLSFAVLESIFFIASNYDWEMSVGGDRAVTALPVNAINSLIMGALLIGARLQSGRHLLMLALAVPILVHALYDLLPFFVLKSGFQLWALVLWFAVLLVSAVLAIYLCNRYLQAASRADAASARDTRKAMRSRHYMRNYLIGGTLLIMASIAVASILLLTKFNDFAWMGAVVAMLPVALGLDLIWEGLRPYRLP
jgi:RsiW-degrading membrane proteinase PrsW (M82 family)